MGVVCSGYTRLLNKTKQSQWQQQKKPQTTPKNNQPNTTTTTTENLQTLVSLLGIFYSGNSLSELTQRMQSYKGKMNRSPQRGENLNYCRCHCLWAPLVPVTMVHTDSGGKCFVGHYILFAHSCICFFAVQQISRTLPSLWKMLSRQGTIEGGEKGRVA